MDDLHHIMRFLEIYKLLNCHHNCPFLMFITCVITSGTPKSWWKTLMLWMVLGALTKCDSWTFWCSWGSVATTHTCLMAWSQVSLLFSLKSCLSYGFAVVIALTCWGRVQFHVAETLLLQLMQLSALLPIATGNYRPASCMKILIFGGLFTH